MFIDNLYDFFKKINYRRILPVLLCPVLLLCTSISAFAYTIPYNSYLFYNPNDDNMSFRIYGFSDVNASNTPYGSGRTNVHFSDVDAVDSARGVRFGFANTGVFEFPFDFENYNYYVALTVVSTLSGDSFPAVPTTMTLGYYEYGDLVANFHIPIVSTQLAGSSNSSGFTVMGAIPKNFPSSFIRYIYARGFSTEFDVSVSDYTVSAVIYEFPVTVGYGDVVTAINNQTNNILNAGSGYGGTTSGILSGNDELSGYIDEYTQIEQTMHNNFESAQSALIGDFTGFTWGSLANTLNWTSDYLQQIYLNSGDFKMMIILPLLLGIALFFIGRGAIILSNSNKDN